MISPVDRRQSLDPTADLYAKVRDAVMCDYQVQTGTKIAILALVSNELLRNMQDAIDEAK